MRRTLLVSLILLAACSSPKPSTSATPTETDHATGPLAASVTVIEYADYQCPACAMGHTVVQQTIDRYSDRVRFIFRVFPLSYHANAIPAGEAAEAAAAQGKFWEMHGKLFETQKEWENLTDPIPTFTGYATELGLDASTFRTALESRTYRAKVEEMGIAAVQAGINSTPSFFINGELVLRGAPQSYGTMQALIDKALMEAERGATDAAPGPSSDGLSPDAPSVLREGAPTDPLVGAPVDAVPSVTPPAVVD